MRHGRGPEGDGGARLRIAVVAADEGRRRSLTTALRALDGADAVAWAESAELLAVLGTRVDVCLCAEPPPPAIAARLRERGCAVAVLPPGGDLVAVVRTATAGEPTPAPVRPKLAPRQREVLLAYVSSSDLVPTIARRLGMDAETAKTHLRRVRAKYAQAGRPAPTRRDLYVRAVEDGLLAPPSEGAWG